ncbi:MAG TPA: PDGLE domain-containing protein, partial [Roseiflexaceae bacterium]|nr:PDGLE domain-containing protein [Roseiflexaceae bacterium]
LVAVFSPLASADPDGLERVAENAGFLSKGQAPSFEIIPDYTMPFLGATPVSTVMAGVLGALVVFAILYTLARALRSRTA